MRIERRHKFPLPGMWIKCYVMLLLVQVSEWSSCFVGGGVRSIVADFFFWKKKKRFWALGSGKTSCGRNSLSTVYTSDQCVTSITVQWSLTLTVMSITVQWSVCNVENSVSWFVCNVENSVHWSVCNVDNSVHCQFVTNVDKCTTMLRYVGE